ncbi:MAG: adenylosuccinate synthase [Phycisphaerales bacterium]|mgnify:FL=1|jgi:adenylosuccinate synthase|nr:adenylosuccinate synthase [Phycisphaerales bacterium]MDP6311647.1 adenylosuccinate synthase [Phycisphaerales bacterium]MDP7087900.1 adenylosuccinate synthase [Phycisphaerales bacterium]MDP7189993.1 adenylosuccinate synthase [Phycisphaerales bacterium]MDP7520156.1 adenylosuccinate synthase [Phycisphaerales bacterium]|tara:strand:+ start:2984 stop:4321 length:1338 start_codon:yes stop_codon:yes gene_type:complete
MMTPSATAVVGLQWGDEGKGKIVDLLAADHDVIVRYNGGANAGHTVVIDGDRYALHLLPSGILSPDRVCVVGNGVVVDPQQLLIEIKSLRERGREVQPHQLLVSDRSHVVMPYHKEHDGALETVLARAADHGDENLSIGTTRRGIGPTYADKVHRSLAIRMGDLLDKAVLRRRLDIVCAIRSRELEALGVDAPPLDAAALATEYHALGEQLAPYITDTVYALHDAVRAGKRLLFEGANACLLDIDHGTFPYVTSSNCSTLGIPPGTGLPGSVIAETVGIVKAYGTRVGEGPFPTEDLGASGERIRERGHEYGTTTGRPRRCGWLDLVAVRYSAMVCGCTSLAVMLLDVLSGFETLKLCTGYRLSDGTVTDRFFPDARKLAMVEPIWETVPGWAEEIDSITSEDQLPAAARDYLDRIADFVGCPVQIASVGPDRVQTIRMTEAVGA